MVALLLWCIFDWNRNVKVMQIGTLPFCLYREILPFIVTMRKQRYPLIGSILINIIPYTGVNWAYHVTLLELHGLDFCLVENLLQLILDSKLQKHSIHTSLVDWNWYEPSTYMSIILHILITMHKYFTELIRNERFENTGSQYNNVIFNLTCSFFTNFAKRLKFFFRI